MTVQDLEAQDDDGYTALAAAAQGGIKEIAETLVTKNRKLVSVFEFKNKKIPLVIASENGHEDMTRYLYDVTPLEELKDKNGVEVLNHCISAGTLFGEYMYIRESSLISSIRWKINDISSYLRKQCLDIYIF